MPAFDCAAETTDSCHKPSSLHGLEGEQALKGHKEGLQMRLCSMHFNNVTLLSGSNITNMFQNVQNARQCLDISRLLP